ncbi:MAG: tetratricopeptide repeat protein [Elusimicrobia bacterium]|nr:tetratricopeptide repeat protein [Elusimicrobiota bacterium]
MPHPGWLAALAGAVILAVFSPILSHGFVNWDDGEMLLANPHLRALGLGELKWMFTTLHFTAYQPLGWLACALVYSWSGPNPAAFHLASILLHLANAAALWLLIARLLAVAEGQSRPTDRMHVAALEAALLWALHPLQVESVAWATEIPDLLSTSLFLAAFLAYLAAVRGPVRRPRRLALALALFVCSGLSRWKGLALPAAMIFADVAPLGRLSRDPRDWARPCFRGVWLEKLPFAAAAAAILAVNWAAKRQIQDLTISLPASAAALARALAFYTGKLLAPFGLHPLYLLSGPESGAPPLWVCVSAAGGITALLALAYRRRPAGLLAWAFLSVSILPTTAAYSGGHVFGQDHYLYLAAAALPALLAWGFLSEWRLGLAAGLALAVLYGTLSWRQCRVWRDSASLWTHALSIEPRSTVGRGNLGAALMDAGRYDEAAALLRRQLEILPRSELDRANLQGALAKKAWLQREPARYYNNLAADLGRLGLAEEAYWALGKSLQLDARLAPTHFNMALVCARLGRPDSARRHYQRALALDPKLARP